MEGRIRASKMGIGDVKLRVMEHLTSYPLSWFFELSCSRHPINRVIGVVVSKHVLKSGDHTDFYRPLGK